MIVDPWFFAGIRLDSLVARKSCTINRCTKNECNPYTGQCQFTRLDGCCRADNDCKHKDPCQTGTCNNGKCVYKPKVCDDKNACTTDSCENGICKFVPKVCDDGNKCTDNWCEHGKCMSKPKKCDDKNP
jgi:hypothetical protein